MRMLVPILMSVAVLTSMLCKSDSLFAQDDPRTASPNGARNANDIVKRLGELEQAFAQLRMKCEDAIRAVDSNTGMLTRLGQSVASNGEAIKTILDQIESNDAAIRELATQVNSNHRRLLDVSQEDGQGGYYPKLLGNMQKPAFRDSLRSATLDSLPRTGQFIVLNQLATKQTIVVNGLRYQVAPGERQILKVPVGTVTLSVAGQAASYWWVGAPKFEQSIRITAGSGGCPKIGLVISDDLLKQQQIVSLDRAIVNPGLIHALTLTSGATFIVAFTLCFVGLVFGTKLPLQVRRAIRFIGNNGAGE